MQKLKLTTMQKLKLIRIVIDNPEDGTLVIDTSVDPPIPTSPVEEWEQSVLNLLFTQREWKFDYDLEFPVNAFCSPMQMNLDAVRNLKYDPLKNLLSDIRKSHPQLFDSEGICKYRFTYADCVNAKQSITLKKPKRRLKHLPRRRLKHLPRRLIPIINENANAFGAFGAFDARERQNTLKAKVINPDGWKHLPRRYNRRCVCEGYRRFGFCLGCPTIWKRHISKVRKRAHSA